MWARIKGYLLAGAKAALLDGIDKMDDLEEPMRNLIIAHGPAAATKIVDLVQEKLRGVVTKLLG